jgi:hypothetical protein
MTMHVRISHPALLPDLVGSLLRSGCVAATLGDDSCAVVHVHALDAEEARREVTFFLGAWRLGHAGVRAVVVG